MSGKKIDILWAFLVGGILSVITEGLRWLLLAIGLSPTSWAITVMLMTLGLIGMVTSYFGLYQKLVGLGGFGAFLPFCSLPCSIMMDYTAARNKGASVGKATLRGLKGPAFVFGTGIGVTIVLALIVYFVQGAGGMIGQLQNAGMLESGPVTLPLFLKAFLIGGLICAVWQIFFCINKRSITLNMAMGIYVGAILTALGAMEYIVSFAGTGMTLMIHATGEGVYRWFSAILLFGDFGGLGRFLLMLAFIFGGSTVLFGELFYRRSSKAQQGEQPRA